MPACWVTSVKTGSSGSAAAAVSAKNAIIAHHHTMLAIFTCYLLVSQTLARPGRRRRRLPLVG